MAKKISRRKIKKEILRQIETIDNNISKADPTQTYQESRKVTDKNGNERVVEVTVCPYDDLLKQKSELIRMYTELDNNRVSSDTILKSLVDIGMFAGSLVFETKNCFTFETVRNFLRRPRR